MKSSVVVAAVILFVVGLAHLLRFIFKLDAVVGGVSIPQWMSIVAAACAWAVAGWLIAEGRKK